MKLTKRLKLDKRITDDILRLTDSKPKELLGWFEGLDKDDEFPCLYNPFKGKYKFYSFFSQHKNEEDIIIPIYHHGIFRLWDWARSSDENFDDIVSQYKKMYGL